MWAPRSAMTALRAHEHAAGFPEGGGCMGAGRSLDKARGARVESTFPQLSHGRSHAHDCRGLGKAPPLPAPPTLSFLPGGGQPALWGHTVLLHLGAVSRDANLSRACSPEGGPTGTTSTNRAPRSSPSQGTPTLRRSRCQQKKPSCPAQKRH